jgi:hypothetical protein
MEKEIDDIINKSEPSEDELDNFKNLVSEWFKYDDSIRKLIIAIKERKNYQRSLNNQIQDFMFKYKYNDLNTQNGRIKANIKEVPKPINIKDIKTRILEFKDLSGSELLEKVFSMDNRPIVEKKTIRRIIPKVSLSLDI